MTDYVDILAILACFDKLPSLVGFLALTTNVGLGWKGLQGKTLYLILPLSK